MINRLKDQTTIILGRTYGALLLARAELAATKITASLTEKRCELLNGRLAVALREARKLEEERDALAKGTTAGEAGELAASLDDAHEELASLRAKLANANGEIFNLNAELVKLREALGTVERIGIVELVRKTLHALEGEGVLEAAARCMRERASAEGSIVGLERELRTAAAKLEAEEREHRNTLEALGRARGVDA